MNRPVSHRHKGSVLMVSLVILLVLTLLGISGMSSTIMQTRMAGNMQGMNDAFQAAEAGLRDGEADVAANISQTTAFTTTCASARCTPADREASPAEDDVWESSKVNWKTGTNTVSYGDNTSAADLVGVRQQPRYIVERLQSVDRGNSIKTGFGAQLVTEWYRVTAAGYGEAGGDPEVILQSVVRK